MSQRVIAYYERDDAQPPGAVLVHLAQALRVSTDELLDLKPVKDGDLAENRPPAQAAKEG